MMLRVFTRWLVILITLFSMQNAWALDAYDEQDPLRPINQITFYFNQVTFALYIKPATRAYDYVMPYTVKATVHNFIRNIRNVHYTANSILQGKLEQTLKNAVRLVINTTFGVFGLFDVATPMGLPLYKATAGETLYQWGWKKSSYLVVPLVGPSTIRDGLGLIGDYFMSPPAYVKPAPRNIFYTIDLIDIHVNNKDILDLVSIAGVNDYDFVRSSYLQYRYYELTGEVDPLSDLNQADLLGEPPA